MGDNGRRPSCGKAGSQDTVQVYPTLPKDRGLPIGFGARCCANKRVIVALWRPSATAMDCGVCPRPKCISRASRFSSSLIRGGCSARRFAAGMSAPGGWKATVLEELHSSHSRL